MFLVITAHKPPPDSSNMLLCDDVESLKHLIWKQEMSNKKLKE